MWVFVTCWQSSGFKDEKRMSKLERTCIEGVADWLRQVAPKHPVVLLQAYDLFLVWCSHTLLHIRSFVPFMFLAWCGLWRLQLFNEHPWQAADHAFKVGHAKQTNGEPPPEWALAKSFLEEVFGHQNVWVESFLRRNLFLEEHQLHNTMDSGHQKRTGRWEVTNSVL